MARLSHKLLLALAITAPAIAGCMGVPTPLAPGVRGSLGVPHRGLLTEGIELPAKGQGFAWLRPYGGHFGTKSLVAAIEDGAAAAYEGPDAPPLMIGDLSQLGGGHLSGHASHRVGRDADLLFFYTTPAGAPVPAPGFIKVGPDGLAAVVSGKGPPRSYVRFDVARSWKLVRALVSSPNAEVLWIFCSEPIEAMLIEYARAKGEDPEVVWHAESVLQQPRDSLPHDDHFHLRVACSPDDAVAGCAGGGPQWPWLKPAPSLAVSDDEWPALLAE